MIFVVDRTNRAVFSDQIEQFFQHRQVVAGCAVSSDTALRSLSDTRADQGDGDAAVYVVEIDSSHKVVAALRLVPTIDVDVLRDRFSFAIAADAMSVRSQIYEMSHWIELDDEDEAEGRERYGHLFCAMFDYGLQRGQAHLTLFCDIEFLPTLLERGWSVTPLGLPVEQHDRVRLAVAVEVSRSVLLTTHIGGAEYRIPSAVSLH